MRLKTKLGGLVTVLLILLLGLAVIGVLTAGTSKRVLSGVAERDLPLVTMVAEATASELQQTIWLYRGLLGGQLESEAAVEEASFEFEQLGTAVAEKIAALRDRLQQARQQASDASVSSQLDEHLQQLDGVDAMFAELQQDGRELLDLIRDGDFMKAELRLPVVEVGVEDLIRSLIEFNAAIAGAARQSAAAAAEQAEASRQRVMVIAMLAVGLALLMGYFIVRSVDTQLGADPQELLNATQALAEGQLVGQVAAGQHGVYRAVNQSIERLREVVQAIQAASYQVATASQQVLDGNADLSSRTQEQASSLEEVAASMEEMSATVTQNAEHAQHADRLAKAARDKANTGNDVVSRAAAAMGRIDESGQRITAILELIEDIAFQTNLLALNAAVEAARAGEHGRGFAVVANEVRKLAGRSATATTDIKGLIKEINSNVADGARLVGQSGEMLAEIVTAARGASDAVSEIAASSVEHSDGISQVKKAVMQMEEMTQQNAALVEEAAAASQSLGGQAEALRKLVAFFRLRHEVSDEMGKAEEEAAVTPAAEWTPEPSTGARGPRLESTEFDDDDWARF